MVFKLLFVGGYKTILRNKIGKKLSHKCDWPIKDYQSQRVDRARHYVYANCPRRAGPVVFLAGILKKTDDHFTLISYKSSIFYATLTCRLDIFHAGPSRDKSTST